MSNSAAFSTNIEDIVERLHGTYRDNGSIDWYAMARDEEIMLYEPAPLIVPAYARIRRENDVKRYIFAPKFLFSDTREFCLGHEYGHHFLKHLECPRHRSLDEMEAEADYFARRLTGIGRDADIKLCCETIAWFFMHPLRVWRAGMGDDSPDVQRCIREAEARS